MNSWQPIETAPVSEHIVMLLEDYVFAGYQTNDGFFYDTFELTIHGDYVCERPTHWMPLPAPPQP